MLEVLPIKLLTDEDSLIFGNLGVNLGKLSRFGLPVGEGLVITPPEFKLKTILEHFNFGSKEVFEQSLSLVKKEIQKIPVPEILSKETKKQRHFYLGKVIKSTKELWRELLDIWTGEIKNRLWKDGFYPGLTQNLTPQVVVFIKKVEACGSIYFDFLQDDSVINIKQGKIHPNDNKILDELIRAANKKLYLPFEYEWIFDQGIKLVGLKPYTPAPIVLANPITVGSQASPGSVKQASSTVKVFLDLSLGLVVEKDVDGIYIASEKIFDLNKPQDSFEQLVFKVVEASLTFPSKPVFLKLADKSEGMGKVRGALRLLHQQSLFNPLMEALDFIRHKKGLMSVQIVVPYVRTVSEFVQIKRNLAAKKLMRKNSLQIWMEICVPENIINLEDYLEAGLDGVVLNLDELISCLNGFDHDQQELNFYKKEIKSLLSFLDNGIKLLHKAKTPFIALGTVCLYPEVLEYLVGVGVWGIVSEKYEVHSIRELLHQAERKLILGRTV